MSANLQRVEAILDQAAALADPAARRDFLENACAGDSELHREVESLLAAYEASGSFLEQPVAAALPPAATDATKLVEAAGTPDQPGDRIGRYKLLEKIGEGGMGVVWMAEQTEPVRRRVALKVIKLGMDTRQVVARFEAERQALALMDHPNIAKVFDGGVTEVAQVSQPAVSPTSSRQTPGSAKAHENFDALKHPQDPQAGSPAIQQTGSLRCEAAGGAQSAIRHPPSAIPSGRPYFVMELVRGLRITDYCDQQRLSTAQRLELFTQVCHAVQHAHQKGIIHRDLKPSNVLVTVNDGVPVPKVIDFGIAKATGQPLTDKTVFTHFLQFLGTPAYMSPEQAEMTSLDIDTRSDIYSLGVLLYELLTGRTPFDTKALMEAGLDEMRRVIREQEPPRPSTRLSTLAAGDLTTTAQRRQTEPPKLVATIRGDLDWIVMKCLEKDRARRYETATALALDLVRHLRHEPVSAVAPTLAYQCGKFARRHRVALALGSAFVLMLVAATAVSLWQVRRATWAEAKARRAQVLAEEQRGLAETNFARARDAVDRYLNRVTDNPRLKESDFFELRKQLLETAVPFYEEFVQQKADEPKLRSEQSRALWKLGLVYQTMGADSKADATFQRALEILEKLTADFPSVPAYWNGLSGTHNDFGILLEQRGQLAQAEAAYRRALTIREKLAADFPTVMAYRHAVGKHHQNLGMLLNLRGQLAEAEAAHRRAQEVFGKLAADFPTVPAFREHLATSRNSIGNVLKARGQREEAEGAYRQALEIQEKLAADFPTVQDYRSGLAGTYNNLGLLLQSRRRWAEADAAYRRALTIREKLVTDFPTVPRNKEGLASTHINLGGLLQGRGQPSEAEAAYRRALEIGEKLVADFPTTSAYREVLAGTHFSLGGLLLNRSQPSEAEAAYRRALEIFEELSADLSTVPRYRQRLATTHSALGNLLQDRGKPSEAETAYRRALEILEKLVTDFPTAPAYREGLADTHFSLGGLLLNRGQPSEAEAAYRRALEIQEKLAADFPTMPAYQSDLGGTLNDLGLILRERKQPEQARDLYERAVVHQRNALNAEPNSTTYRRFLRNHHSGLSQTYIQLGDHAASVTNALQLPKLYPNEWKEHYRAAGLIAQCVPLAAQDEKLNAETRRQTAEDYALQSVALLRAALANGYKDAAKLANQEEFAALKDRPDFQALLGGNASSP